jgi:hypothetical protein
MDILPWITRLYGDVETGFRNRVLEGGVELPPRKVRVRGGRILRGCVTNDCETAVKQKNTT